MKISICKSDRLMTCLLFIAIAFFVNVAQLAGAASIEGQWCENGKPYTCYPPVTNQSDAYICTDSTVITKADAKSLQWNVKETLHFYSDGFMNGKSKSRQYSRQFIRQADATGNIYKHGEKSDAATRSYKLVAKDDEIDLVFEQIPLESDATRIHQNTIYRRCDEKLNKETYYTALVDCSGFGDYIAGVPAVIEDPLQWDSEDDEKHGATCRVAAKCWGGGWVAYAYSNESSQQSKAFGAACGSASRHDAKQQAINTCRESGGSNCLFTVVSGFDNGTTDSGNISHKGIKVESCSNGDCKILASE